MHFDVLLHGWMWGIIAWSPAWLPIVGLIFWSYMEARHERKCEEERLEASRE